MNDGETLQAPSGVSAKAAASLVNQVSFAGAGPGDNFEIWRRHGDTVDWYLHATTTEPGFEDKNVEAGQYYEYKVRTVRGDSLSEFSPSVVAYGAE